MPEIPDCLNRRYRALDDLIQELSSQEPLEENGADGSSDPEIRLMCDFWNILKEDPDCNLTQAVKQRMGLTASTRVFKQQRVTCYQAGKCTKENNSSDNKDTLNKPKMSCSSYSTSSKEGATKCCERDGKAQYAKNLAPLSKVLCTLKEAASYDKQCFARVNELMNTQKELQAQIQLLENREKEGIQLLKEADCMWTSMEDAYKQKVAESLERQEELMKQLQEVEASNAKWRKNKKDLDGEMKQITKCHLQITEKIAQKISDIRCLKTEIAHYKRRIENNKKDADNAGKVLSNKKQASDKKIAAINAEATNLKKKLSEERKRKQKKEEEGQQYVKEAREDLQKICRVLLQKKLENENLIAEKDALEQEIDLLKQSCNLCEEKCKDKEKTLTEQIEKLDEDIILFGGKCIRCHQTTDTVDIRKYCSDCPRCKAARECLVKGDYCEVDPGLDCVCMSVKEKLLDNVFENMYTVLERQSRTDAGKTVADMIVTSLKNSKNGKLDKETRMVLQDFVLATVKKNLNLTIIGGAVKTRCEMEPETYKQLMLCLTTVLPPEKALKADKGTVAKQESCRRWGSSVECNCPGGAKACICTKRAPPKVKEVSPAPPVPKEEEFTGISCPYIEKPTPCGPDCAKHMHPNVVGKDIAAWRPDPCSGPSCHYSKNMRAAQCVLGPESLDTFKSSAPYIPETPDKACDCDTKMNVDRKNLSSRPREIIIEEVMGSYNEVTPIAKVSCSMLRDSFYDE